MAGEQEGRNARLLAASKNIARLVAEANTLTELAPAVLEEVGTAAGWQLAALWWVDEERSLIRCHTTWLAPGAPDRLDRPGELARGEGVPGRVWSVGAPVATADVLVHPILMGTEVVGAIEVEGGAEQQTEALLDIVEYVAWQLGHFATREAQRKRLEDALREGGDAETRRLEADRLAALASLAGGISHEINNALTYVWLSLGRLITHELSRRPLTPVRFHRIELLQDVREGFTRVERVARELKQFARVDEGPQSPLDIGELITSVLSTADREIAVRAKVVCELGEVPPIAARPGMLRQVFLNLLLNAAQSIPEGRAEQNEIRVVTRTDSNRRVIVEVRDTGRGIEPDHMSRIFDPFFTTQKPGRGLGLGLSVCRDIVTSLGGEISAESAPDRGTIVRVALPSVAAQEPRPSESSTRIRAARAAPVEPFPIARHAPARVLIVDDDRPVAAAIALELSHCDAVVADGGREALDILRRDKDFDVVFCDLMMPNVTGMDLYETLKGECPEIVERFVFMTGGAFTTRSRVFLATVPNLRLDKPFRANELATVVERFMKSDGQPLPAERHEHRGQG